MSLHGAEFEFAVTSNPKMLIMVRVTHGASDQNLYFSGGPF